MKILGEGGRSGNQIHRVDDVIIIHAVICKETGKKYTTFLQKIFRKLLNSKMVSMQNLCSASSLIRANAETFSSTLN
jgi:hypothetical protein